jgi:serine/threonine protein kinase
MRHDLSAESEGQDRPRDVDDLGFRLQDALGEGYRVEHRLGAGGFAVVFAVRDLNLKRPLAVKVLSPDLITSRAVLERFRREAETVAQLSHPNIVPLHFVGQKDDLIYLVMQAIDGGTLAERLDRDGALPIDEAVRILCEIAGALAHAHKRGVIHRDIKPENVLLDAETGRALVTDFGIARTADGSPLTSVGIVVGTAAYLSPEQAAGEPSDQRADIYALGVLAYQMLTGRLPFSGATPSAVLMKRLAGPPEPLRNVRPEIPEPLAEIVESCLVVEPDRRPGDAGDLVRVLRGESPVSGFTNTRPVVTTTGSRTRSIVIIAALIIVAVSVIAFVANRSRSPLATKSASAISSVDSSMVVIPAGRYTIGNNSGPSESRPAHTVDLPAFGIDVHEVTTGDYDAFVQAGRAPAPWKNRAALKADIPITGVTLAEAMNYCAWRHSDGGRLPREEEWEAAARGEEARTYPWGNTWDATATNTGSRFNRPVAVASFPRGKTPLGIDDLIGNVWEWTASPFHSYSDPTASGSDLYVIRGGAYNSYDQIATSFFRGRAQPAAARSDLAATGFRCVMSVRN